MSNHTNFKGAQYSATRQGQTSDIRYYLKNYNNLFKKTPQMVIADVGCGDGFATSEVLAPYFENFKEIVGLDIAPSMVDFGNQNYSKSNLKFQVLDIATENMPDSLRNKFDLVFSGNCLHWCHLKLRDVHENIFEMLQPGGQFFAYFLSTFPYYTITKNLSEYEKYKTITSNFNQFYLWYLNYQDKLEWYTNLLQEVGFDVNICKLLNKNFTFDSVEQYLNAMMSLNPFTIPSDMLDEYRDDYLYESEKMGTVYMQENKKVATIRYQQFVALANKL